jgi:hypothetical protein
MSDLAIKRKNLEDTVFAALLDASGIEAETQDPVWFDEVSHPLTQILNYLRYGIRQQEEDEQFTVQDLEGINEPPTN